MFGGFPRPTRRASIRGLMSLQGDVAAASGPDAPTSRPDRLPSGTDWTGLLEVRRHRPDVLCIVAAGCEKEPALRVSREQVEENRTEVIDTAARVFREKGFDGIGIATLMEEAGLTHGGFYRHFRSKDDLAVQACRHAFSQKQDELLSHIENAPADPFATLIRQYVSSEHRDHPETGCSLTTLAADAARRDDPELRAVFTDAVAGYIKLLSAVIADAPAKEKRRAAVSTLAEMVGAVVLSRVVADRKVAQELIESVADDLIGRHGKSAATPK